MRSSLAFSALSSDGKPTQVLYDLSDAPSRVVSAVIAVSDGSALRAVAP